LLGLLILLFLELGLLVTALIVQPLLFRGLALLLSLALFLFGLPLFFRFLQLVGLARRFLAFLLELLALLDGRVRTLGGKLLGNRIGGGLRQLGRLDLGHLLGRLRFRRLGLGRFLDLFLRRIRLGWFRLRRSHGRRLRRLLLGDLGLRCLLGLRLHLLGGA